MVTWIDGIMKQDREKAPEMVDGLAVTFGPTTLFEGLQKKSVEKCQFMAIF
jgi:hypothetical protein